MHCDLDCNGFHAAEERFAASQLGLFGEETTLLQSDPPVAIGH